MLLIAEIQWSFGLLVSFVASSHDCLNPAPDIEITDYLTPYRPASLDYVVQYLIGDMFVKDALIAI